MNEIIVITGQRGCGKSSYIKQILRNYPRLLIYDLLGEFSERQKFFSVQDFYNTVKKQSKRSVWKLVYYNPKSDLQDFLRICQTVNSLYDVCYVVDELDYFCSATYCPSEFAELIKRGRHQKIVLVVATRRPHEIPRLITSQVTKFVTFRHVEKRDVDYVKYLTGINDEELKNLNDFEYIEFSKGFVSKGKTTPLNKIPSQS